MGRACVLDACTCSLLPACSCPRGTNHGVALPYAASLQEKKQREKEQRSQEGGEGDADMMALMGFGGFGTSKK